MEDMDSLQSLDGRVQALRRQVQTTESQLRDLKIQLQQAEQQAESSRQLEQAWAGGLHEDWINEALAALSPTISNGTNGQRSGGWHDQQRPSSSPTLRRQTSTQGRWPLDAEEYKRYGRQMILPEIGLHGQLRLKNASVLIVGVGGLGCPAAAYLAGAGVGTLGLIDGDNVEVSNLHRQIAHGTRKIGMSKVDSAVGYLSSLNPLVNYQRHYQHLTPESAIPIFQQYDLVLDCTDHPTSRYLISDACVLTSKPLVSASALKTEGQLIVLNNPPKPQGDMSGGPCYRCIFPKPPPTDSVLSCGEGGILGPVVGVMGVLQTLEAIKVLSAQPHIPDIDDLLNGMDGISEPPKPTLLMYSAYSQPPFRSVRMRTRRPDCAACSPQAMISPQSLLSGSLDYVAFCGTTAPLNAISPDFRISASDFARLPRDGSNMLVDVRDATQYAMCALRGSINIPWTGSGESWAQAAGSHPEVQANLGNDCYVVCRLGNDSQLAAKALIDHNVLPFSVKDIKGGFRAWREEVDAGWPDY